MFLSNLDNNPKLMKNSVYYNFDYGVGEGGFLVWIGNGLTFLFRVKISAEKTDCSNVSVHLPIYHAFVSFV